jgi:hypothetical protein
MNRPLTPHERAAIADAVASLDRLMRILNMPRNFTHHIEYLVRWLRNL